MSNTIERLSADRPQTERLDRVGVWIRRGGVCVLLAVVVIALLNVVGQRASTSTASSPEASLTVRAPKAVRSGLLFQGRFAVTAHRPLSNVQLVLGRGWIDGLTMNTEEPAASTETSGPNGSLVFALGSLKAGQTFVQYLEYQVNPTSIGGRNQYVGLRSGNTDLISMNHHMTIVP